MRFDAQLIKEQVSLAEIFRGDGHELKKAGPDYYKCRCPFHQEKTASCVVHDRPENYFKCFGCAEGGSVFDYWMKTRNCDFNTAITQLVGAAAAPAMKVRSERSEVRSEAPELAARMDVTVAKTWAAAVNRLKEHPNRVELIAQWRGYSAATVYWANELGLIGMVPFLGIWREAFLVERPRGQITTCMDGCNSPEISDNVHAVVCRSCGMSYSKMVPVGYHVRLAPRSAGNKGDKASWRYMPTGIGNWPFVLGDVATARVIFFLEGQWDALALVDCMGWSDAGLAIGEKKFPKNVAIVGMRGATSWKRFMDHYTWSDEVVAFVLGDADTAGNTWCEKDGFITQLRLRCSRVWGMFPKHGKDFNDVWKERLITRDQLAMILRDKMRHKIKGRRNAGVTFLQFCRAQRARQDAIGGAARMILGDPKHRPTGRKPLKVWERYFHKYVPEDNRSAMYATWREWVRQQRDVASSLQKVAA